jgi:hypothetical protein
MRINATSTQKRKNTYVVIINVKKNDNVKKIPCGSKQQIKDELTKLNAKGLTSYTFTLLRNGITYKEFNFVKSIVDFIKFLPLIDEEEN